MEQIRGREVALANENSMAADVPYTVPCVSLCERFWDPFRARLGG